MNKQNHIDQVLDENNNDKAILLLGNNSKEELEQRLLPDMGMHYLLSVTLSPGSRFDDQLLQRVHDGIHKQSEQPTKNTQPKQSKNNRVKKWLLFYFPTLFLTFLGGVAYFYSPAQFHIEEKQNDTWIISDYVIEDSTIIANQALRLRFTENNYIDLKQGTIVSLSENQNEFYLKKGTLQIQSNTTQIIGASGSARGNGQWIWERNDFRDRISVLGAQVHYQDKQQNQKLDLQNGEIWDISSPTNSRKLHALDAGRFPLLIDSDQSLGGNLLEKINGQENMSINISPHAALTIPFMAPAAYDLRISLKRLHGQNPLALQIPRMGNSVSVFMLDGWQSTRHGFALLGSNHDQINPTVSWNPQILQANHIVNIECQIRGNRVAIYINGHLLSWLKGDESLTPSSELLWPSDSNNDTFRILPRSDSFDVLRVECRVYADGVGANHSMYGPQL